MRTIGSVVHRIACAAALLCALPVAALRVSLDVPADLLASWQRLLAAHPLPAGTELGDPDLPDRIVLERRRSPSPTGEPPVPAPGERIVERIPLAPVAKLEDMADAVASDALNRGGWRMLGLDGISLPQTALGVDGLWPGEGGWNLYEQVVARIGGVDPDLAAWFAGVEELPPEPVLWIAAVGDLMPARGVDAALLAPGGIDRVFGDTLPLLRGTVLTAANLEAAATTRGTKAAKTYTFRFRPDALAVLRDAGITTVNLANNHAFDYGATGFLDTLDALAARGIAAPGAGRTLQEASRPLEVQAGGTTFRVLSVGAYRPEWTGFDGARTAAAGTDKPGVLWLDEGAWLALESSFGPATFDIVLVHAGTEWASRPDAAERALFRGLVDRGADVVIGTHPHVVQGIEAYGGGLIAYSLGNFIFPGMELTQGGTESFILRLGIWRGAIRCVRVMPVKLAGTTVRTDPAPTLRSRLAALSRALSALR